MTPPSSQNLTKLTCPQRAHSVVREANVFKYKILWQCAGPGHRGQWPPDSVGEGAGCEIATQSRSLWR